MDDAYDFGRSPVLASSDRIRDIVQHPRVQRRVVLPGPTPVREDEDMVERF
eukprot:SAG31_NODE_8796_length_1385_cov_2.485226_2_plen_51_part_00